MPAILDYNDVRNHTSGMTPTEVLFAHKELGGGEIRIVNNVMISGKNVEVGELTVINLTSEELKGIKQMKDNFALMAKKKICKVQYREGDKAFQAIKSCLDTTGKEKLNAVNKEIHI